MLRSGKKFGFREGYEFLYPDASESLDSAILKDSLRCPNNDTCFIWATVYRNISTTLEDLEVEFLRGWGHWTDENKMNLLLCEQEDGVGGTFDFAPLVRKTADF
jgi:hypothetical protein